jgi:hypothetical protein
MTGVGGAPHRLAVVGYEGALQPHAQRAVRPGEAPDRNARSSRSSAMSLVSDVAAAHCAT